VTHKLKVKEWKKIYQAWRNQKSNKAGVAILISDTADIIQPSFRGVKEGPYIVIKGQSSKKI
jgi:hypothetical protein